MPAVDRNVLRLGIFELFHGPSTPFKVVLDEAIELAKRYGTEESPAFVNGILDRVKGELNRPARKGLVPPGGANGGQA